jgi:hypothetical protein
MDTLNVKKAAGYASISKSTLDKLRVYGGGPIYIKVGARVVYDRTDLDTWLVGKKIANTSQANRGGIMMIAPHPTSANSQPVNIAA